MDKNTRKTLVWTLVSLLGTMPITNVEAPVLDSIIIRYFNPTKLNTSEIKKQDLVRSILSEDIRMQIKQEEEAINFVVKEIRLLERDKIYRHIFDAYENIDVPKYISKKFVRTQIWAESRDYIKAIGKDGEMGLMQIMPGTWKKIEPKLNFKKNAFNPKYNIPAGIKHLVSLDRELKRRNSKWEELSEREKRDLIAAAYNCGIGGITKAKYNIDKAPEKTRKYVRDIERWMSGRYKEY
jgi:hypothetical protein